MRKTDINYSIIRAKRNGCGCPAHHSSLFSIHYSLRESFFHAKQLFATSVVF